MVPQAIAAGNIVTPSADPVVDLLAAAQNVAEAEANRTAAAVAIGWQYRAASIRSNAFTGSPVGTSSPFPLMVAGLGVKTDPVFWGTTAADVVVADWQNVLIRVRQDLRFDFSNSAVLQDDTGGSATPRPCGR